MCGMWPLLRAVPQRALLLLSDPPLRPVRDVPEKSANKRVSHLAAQTARQSGLGDPLVRMVTRSRAHPSAG